MNLILLIIGIILVICAGAFSIISYKEESAKRIIGGLLLVVGLAFGFLLI